MRHVLLSTLAAAALCALASPARAQTGETGLLEGRVVDAKGAPLPGAQVRLALPDGSYPRLTTSGTDGQFRINFIVPGTYTVTARNIGYRPATVTGVAIRATQRAAVTLTLEATAVEIAEIAVQASPVAVDPTTTEFGVTLQDKERELLPTARNANDLVAFTPGARPGQVYGGSTAQANLFQFDGVTVNQPGRGGSFLLPNVDWIQSIEVKGLGAGAEYGNFQGGLVNVVTKSGSNTWQGALRTFYENASLNAENVNAFEQGSETANRTEVNAEIRGPIVRDKVFFYLSGQEAYTHTRVVDAANATAGDVTFLGTQAERHEQKYYGKLTWQATAKDIFNGAVGIDNVFRQRIGLSAFDAVDATYRGDSPSVFYNGSWLRTFDPSKFLEVKLSGYSGDDNELPYNGSDRPAVKILGAPGQFRNSFYTRRNSPKSFGSTVNFDWFTNTGSVAHHLKLGGDATFGWWRERRTRNGGLTWYGVPDGTTGAPAFDPANPATWGDLGFGDGTYATTDWGGRIDLNARTLNAALFLQDYIQVTKRLAVNPGLRYGYWRGRITPGNEAGTAAFTAVTSHAVDPRLGATFDLTGKGDFVAKAHFGQYRQSLFAFMFDRAPGGNVFTNIEYWDWANKDKTLLPDVNRQYTIAERDQLFTPAGGSSLFNEANRFQDYRQPYINQFVAGLEKQLTRHLKAEVVYVNRVNKNVIALRDLNVATNFTVFRNVSVLDLNGDPVAGPNGAPLVLDSIFVRNDDLRRRLVAGNTIPGFTQADTANLGFNQDLVIGVEPKAKRKFDQLQFVLSGAYPTWQFNLGVTVTRLEGNLFTVNGYESSVGQGNGPFVEPNGQINYYGKLQNYSPVELKLRVSGNLKWGLEGGAFLTYFSGDRYTPTYAINRRANDFVVDGVTLPSRLFTNVDGQGILLERKGDRKYDGYGQLDLRLQKAINLRSFQWVVGLEAFNIFNAGTVTEVKTSVNDQDPGVPSTLYGATLFRLPPRTLRLNSQLRF